MRKAIATTIALLAGLVPAVALLSSANAATVNDGPTAVFLIPHQDDETTSMGASIKATRQAGKDHVVLVLLTDGSESGVCYDEYGTGETRANGGLSATHRADCTAQRDAEFKAAADQLGVDYIIRSDRKQDGCTNKDWDIPSCNSSNTLTKAYIRHVIDDMQAKYGNDTAFKSMSYLEDRHCNGCNNGTKGVGEEDHAVVGRALLDAYNQNDVGDARFYVKPTLWNWWPGAKAGKNIGFWSPRKSINLVLNKYGSAAPDPDGDGIAGIGQMSTSNMCEQYDPRPGLNHTSTQRGVMDCSKYDFFGDAPDAVYGGQAGSSYPNIADGGADSYIHVPNVTGY